MKRQSSMLKVFTLSSPDDSYDENFLSNYLNINIKPRIQRIQGVGEFFALGGDYAMRIWMKPDVMAQYKLIPSGHYRRSGGTKHRIGSRYVRRELR